MLSVAVRASQHVFFGVSALIFTATAALTIAWSVAMSSMGGMPMPGGWTMSMTWMRMPGQTWLGAAASFLGMWVVMMAAMMLPSLFRMLWRYREAMVRAADDRSPDRLTALAGAGYFFVWTAVGFAVFVLGVAAASMAMAYPALARTAPFWAAAVVLAAGALQFTKWKARQLACCREFPGHDPTPAARPVAAWRYGLGLGLHCSLCCAGLTAILVVAGIMDLRAMAAVTVAITLERLAPHPERVVRAIGSVAVAGALLLMARAAGLG
jgi:predicted metal-binding membrane protein